MEGDTSRHCLFIAIQLWVLITSLVIFSTVFDRRTFTKTLRTVRSQRGCGCAACKVSSGPCAISSLSRYTTATKPQGPTGTSPPSPQRSHPLLLCPILCCMLFLLLCILDRSLCDSQQGGRDCGKQVDWGDVSQISPPKQLHSDQKHQFECSLMSDVCHLLGIWKSRTTPYHPHRDGLVEHFNKTLLNMLASFTQKHPFTWEDHLQRVCMVYNSSLHPIHTFLLDVWLWSMPPRGCHVWLLPSSNTRSQHLCHSTPAITRWSLPPS